MSFTLNRVYTEWYRNKGKDYTITSSTAYDHKWIRGRNIFDSIDRIVDELSRIIYPVLTSVSQFLPSTATESGCSVGTEDG